MSTTTGTTPQGPVPAIGIPDSQDYPRLVYTAPYFQTVPLADLIEQPVLEAVEAALPALVPPYVDAAAAAAVNARAVLRTGSTMSGPLYLAPAIPTQPSQAASMAYVDLMVSTAGVPEVPVVPSGQTWARQTGQWVPIDDSGASFLSLSGGTMAGPINMAGSVITNLPPLPVMPNGAAPASWVLSQIAAQSLYQGTWNLDTYMPDLTAPATHENGFTWIAVTTSLTGVVVTPAIPGLQGQTVFNGDTAIYSALAGQFQHVHSGGLTLDEASALFLSLSGGQMSGSLLLHANATQPTEAVTLQQMNTAVGNAGIGEAPVTGQLYGRNGQANSWSPVLALAGGTMTGAITLSGNAAQPLNAVPLQQLQSTVSAGVAPMVPLAGATMSGPLLLSGNATASLGAVPLQQMNAAIAAIPLGTVENSYKEMETRIVALEAEVAALKASAVLPR